MDFQPAVSIMSVAWLKTEVLRIVTQLYKKQMHKHTVEKSRKGRITAEEQLNMIDKVYKCQ